MSNILLTGGRAPAALELARVFHRAGHTVFSAESLQGHLSQPSNAIKENFIVPSPRWQKDAFIAALKNIVIENKIDLLVPTCEEVFYIAMGRDEIPCGIFAESSPRLNDLHNKWIFVIKAVGEDLSVPETMLVVTQDDMLHAYSYWKELVLKPVYSRFASRTLIKYPFKLALSNLLIDPDYSWVAQEYLAGRQFCSYSVCHEGRVVAHTVYPADFTAGQGAAVVFQHINHPAIFQWVKTFVGKYKLTGQVAFDFIQTSDGRIWALECNPRATSGVHLLASHPQFAESFFNPSLECISPTGEHSYMLSAAMLVYGLPDAVEKKRLGEWFSTFFSSKDVVFDFKDPLPFMLQLRSILAYQRLGREKNITPIEASTYDIEWNGDEE